MSAPVAPSRWKAALAGAAIFAAGALAGAFADRLWTGRAPADAAAAPLTVDALASALRLDESERARVAAVLDSVEPGIARAAALGTDSLQEAVRQARERIEDALPRDRRAEFESWMQQHRAHMMERMRHRGWGGMMGPGMMGGGKMGPGMMGPQGTGGPGVTGPDTGAPGQPMGPGIMGPGGMRGQGMMGPRMMGPGGMRGQGMMRPGKMRRDTGPDTGNARGFPPPDVTGPPRSMGPGMMMGVFRAPGGGIMRPDTVLAPDTGTALSPLAVRERAAAPAAPTAPGAGERLFIAKGCAGCHGADGRGGVGPPLAGTALEFDAFLRQIRRPRALMPSFPRSLLSDAGARQIYTYLRALEPAPRAHAWSQSFCAR